MESSNCPSEDYSSLPITHSEAFIPEVTPSTPMGASSKREALTPSERIVNRLTQTAIANIEGQIMLESFTIPSSARMPIFTPQPMHQQSLKLSQIVKRKKELTQEIYRLQYEESRIKEQPQKQANSRSRSLFTKEEQKAIAKALHAHKALQEELELKNKRLEAQILEKSAEEEAKRKERIMKLSTQKHAKAEQNLQQLQKRKITRTKQIQELNKKFQSVKAKTFLHEKMEVQWKDHEKQDQQETKEMLNERKRQKAFSMKEIIGHEHQYRSFLASNSKEKAEKLLRQKMEKEALEKQTLSLYEPSKYLQTVFEEEKRQKQIEEERAEIQKNLLQTKMKYGDSIRELHKDSLKKRSLPAIKEQQQAKTGRARSLSRLEIAEIGNRYIREVHSSIGEVYEKQTQSSANLSPLNQKVQKQQGYLQAMRKKRASEQVQNPEIKQLRELKTVLSKKTDLKDKLYMAKLVAGKLNERTQGDTGMLLASINAKLKIIDTFS